jgi:hypothetical protein
MVCVFVPQLTAFLVTRRARRARPLAIPSSLLCLAQIRRVVMALACFCSRGIDAVSRRLSLWLRVCRSTSSAAAGSCFAHGMRVAPSLILSPFSCYTLIM